ncbi:hypothetical protein ACN265_18945 [Micromonospora sp. WMMD730]|uniref:hypothetical protein n=1 Tax=Micromonospora sp. WMMD730 TaxID=3404128 RepID=UPI003B94CF79
MITVILTWDAGESGYPSDLYARDVRRTAGGKAVSCRWSVGSRRGGLGRGDRVFLFRQNRERGIVASGAVTGSSVFADAHWEAPTRQAWYITLRWDTVLPVEDRLSVEKLLAGVPTHHWNHVLGSGQRLYPPSDEQLERLWWSHLAALRASPAGLTAEPVPVSAAVTPAGSAEAVPIEKIGRSTYSLPSSESAVAVKREADLMARYQEHLEALGHTCARYRIRPPGEPYDLYTDLFDQTAGVLYEAKGVVTRDAIRMAVGQLLDYSRHIPGLPERAVLLPAQPGDDLLALLRAQNIQCVYELSPGRYGCD